MVPPKPGIYWIKTRIRYTINDPPDGRQGWMIAEYDPEDVFGWMLLGDEDGLDDEMVVRIGPEVVPPADEEVSHGNPHDSQGDQDATQGRHGSGVGG